jgi:nucleoside-diphosphate-sugar epimerase
MTEAGRVGVLGASSFVGQCLLSSLTNWRVTAYSRKNIIKPDPAELGSVLSRVEWRQLPDITSYTIKAGDIPLWICVAPVWVLPEYFTLLEAHGVKRVVVLSSTSRFTKNDSSDTQEQDVARRLADAELHVQKWAERCGVEWVILRPTLIYGQGRDKNIVEIARFIKRFGFFPLFGKACGLRQPVHAEAVAAACIAALHTPNAANRAYNLSGGETLTYRDMVARVFTSLDRRPRYLVVPLWIFGVAVAVLRYSTRYRKWSSSMAKRMNMDMVFDHTEATQDLGFAPEAFVLEARDLPV